MIVHMATWKDLTKWNEENTIMDCINHMWRIVKRVFSVPSRLQHECHASEKDLMAYYVLSPQGLGKPSFKKYVFL